MQNFGRFYTTSEFDREYLRKETRYPKLERYTTSNDSSRVEPNKSGEPWSTIHKVVHTWLWVWTHSNRLIRQTIFRPLGGAGPWNIYTR